MSREAPIKPETKIGIKSQHAIERDINLGQLRHGFRRHSQNAAARAMAKCNVPRSDIAM
jgi:hypothetical protein